MLSRHGHLVVPQALKEPRSALGLAESREHPRLGSVGPITFPGQGTALRQVPPLGGEELWVLGNCFMPAAGPLAFPCSNTWAPPGLLLKHCRFPTLDHPPPLSRPMNPSLRVGLRTTAPHSRATGCDRDLVWSQQAWIQILASQCDLE